ncbi:kinase-like domain-containing protein [Rhizophagus clarus]|uniref:Kinase-like domain-containing protein n=1 Tax=Rhizophagus clarus TaxID=94130 RepID=A0A8H3L1X0_9GLOM|nr:kinase-like domain-containing protein [Rhizophagus clarus]
MYECFSNLIKKCWDSDPSKRPTIDEIWNSFFLWCRIINEADYFKQAEIKRSELIQLRKLGPEFSEKSHPKAIYTSRALSSLISMSSAMNSFAINNSFNVKQEYITREFDFDVGINNTQSLSVQNVNSAVQNSFNSQHQNYISEQLNELTSTIAVNSSRKLISKN